MCYTNQTNELHCDEIQENPALTTIEPIEFFETMDAEFLRILQEIRNKERGESIERVLYIAFWLCVFYIFILELLKGRYINTNEMPV